MTFVHCRRCGEKIHESALTCPKCGAQQGIPSRYTNSPDLTHADLTIAAAPAGLPSTQRPKSVSTATNMLWASLAVGFVKSVFAMPTIAEGANVLAAVVAVSVFAGLALLNLKIASGRNWARCTLLGLFLVGLIPVFLFPALSKERSSDFATTCLALQTLLQGCALVMLFTTAPNRWFKAQRRLSAPIS